MAELTATIAQPYGSAVRRKSPWLTLVWPMVHSVQELVGSMLLWIAVGATQMD